MEKLEKEKTHPVDCGKVINVDALKKLSREQIHELWLLTRNL